METTNKYILLKIIIVIASLEFLIMQIFVLFGSNLTSWEEALLDTFLLSIFSAPLLYKFVINPFVKKEELALKKLHLSSEIFSENVISSKADLTGKIIYASKALCEISGYTQAELIGKQHSILRHPETPSALFKDLWETIESGRAWKGEYKNKTKDGGFYWVRSTVLPELDSDNNIIGYHSIRHDISKSKVNEELQKRLELTLIGNNDGIWDWNLQTNDVYYSPRWKEIIGYKDDELKNEFSSWETRVHPDDLEVTFKEVQENIEGKTQYYSGIHRLKHKDGSWVWILSRAKAIYENGVAIRMAGTHTDITQQKEEELTHKERGNILENSLNEIYICDAKTYRFLYLNKTAENNIGYVMDEMRIMTPLDIAPEMTKETLDDAFNALNEEITPSVSFSTFQQRKDKTIYHTDVFLQKTTYENSEAYVAIILDTTEKVKAQNKLKHQAHHDALTGLPNRVLFNDRLEQGIEKAKRNTSKIALLFLDLDHFKEINDSLGHDAGDIVLKTVTSRLQAVIRAEDTISRLGGDEFSIILEDLAQAEDASSISNKILKVLSKEIVVNNQTLYISSSIGISIYPDDGENPSNLLKFADSAMYKAKAEGRNNFQYYDAKLTALAFERVVMETSLRVAIQDKQFIVHYQPQIDARDDKLTGMEALVRWNHPTMGLVPPIKFIALAETTGLIVELDRMVMKIAMTQIVEWYEDGLNPGVIAINLSVKQLQSKDCLSTFERLLKETRCRAEWIELEVTESQIMANPEEAIKKLQAIRDLGISLAVDDFGTGYSSLAYLKRLPIDKLKIDREFIKDLPGDEEDSGITEAIIALCKSLNLRVIAEGVETKEQKDFLVEHGCNSIQGYLYSKPIDGENFKSSFLFRSI